MSATEIKTANLEQVDQCLSTLILSFSSDPVVRWIYPEPHKYSQNFPLLVKAFGEKAFEQGTVHYINKYFAVSVWLQPGVFPDEESIFSLFEHSVPKNRHSEMFQLFETISKYHPEQPHWYLPFIGTDPNKQGGGYGSTLLQLTLAMCDRDRALAYLEASSERSAVLYERHGFDALGEIQLGSSPLIIPMLRSPK